MENGYIFLHRKIREHWIWDNPEYLKWWIDLLLMVNHKPKKILLNGVIETIDIGEHHTSESKLAERWFASRPTVDKFLKLLKNDKMIEINKSRQNGTTIKVCNYQAYQVKNDDDSCNEIYNDTNNEIDIESATKLHKQEPKNEKKKNFSSEHDSDGAEFDKKNKKTHQPRKRIYEPDSAYYKAALWLADNIQKNNPGAVYPTEANLQSWADEARKLVELDKVELDMFKRVLNFARNDDFWQTNILSMGTYRDKYNQLLAKYNAERSG